MAQGLTHIEAKKLLDTHGENILPQKHKRTQLQLILSQFSSILITILIGAGVVTLLLKEYSDALIIMLAVFLNAGLGYYQESKAERALVALKNMISPQAKVFRDNERTTIESKYLVPGDVVILSQGDKIPADGVLTEVVNFSVNEAILTGESMPVRKKKDDMVYMGSICMVGRAMYTVSKTGEETKMGKIAEDIDDVEEGKTPLQIRLNQLARQLAIVLIGVSVAVFFIGILSQRSAIDMFKTAVALAVASIPEGLVISLTVILALGMQRILKRKALVRKLLAAETLGTVTTIATDKTGTLTEGLMRVTHAEVSNKKDAIKTAVLVNNLEDPLEVALWEWAEAEGLDARKLFDSKKRSHEKPFDSNTKYMSVTVDSVVYVKGAPEVVMEMCALKTTEKKEIQKRIDNWSSTGVRIIALAHGLHGGKHSSKLDWIGMIGFEDPVRDDLVQVFKDTKRAGIRTIMITGDYAGTAEAVWRKINEYDSSYSVNVVEGEILSKMSDTELAQSVRTTEIFARVSPDQKLRIVKALSKNGEITALIGDGVNDAPALKEANIGVVVGGASDVAKETADIVLLDSNFKTIVSAIEEGRGIFDNLKKVLLYLLTDSFSQTILIGISIFFELPLPLTAAQIIWINVITDGWPAIALAFEPKEKDLLKRKPLSVNEPLVDNTMKLLTVVLSVITALVSLWVFIIVLQTHSVERAQTLIFASIGLITLLNVFIVRSFNKPIWRSNIFANKMILGAVVISMLLQIASIYHPLLNQILHTVPLALNDWLIVAGMSVGILIALESVKDVYLFNRRGAGN